MSGLTQERLKELLHYDPNTGLFTWIKVTSNRVKVGTVAGNVNYQGYLGIGIDGTSYGAHRLAFLYMLGRWPHQDVDHKDMKRANNAWGNLREATRSENSANKTAYANSTTGVKGVYASGDKFLSRIQVNGRHRHLGTFDTIESAHAAYEKAANDNFGEFARAA